MSVVHPRIHPLSFPPPSPLSRAPHSHLHPSVSTATPYASRISVPTPSIRRYEASRIRPRPDPLSQTGLFYGLHLQKLYCSVHPLHSLGRHPSQKSFLLPHTDTRPRRDYSSQYAGARADTEERSRHTRVYTRAAISPYRPARAQKSTPKSGRDWRRRGGECFRSSRLSARLSFRSRKRVSGSQRVGELCDGVGKEGCDERRERERERRKRNGKIVERSIMRISVVDCDRFELT